MNLKNLINDENKIQIVVSSVDLKEFLLDLIAEVKKNPENVEKEEVYVSSSEAARLLCCTTTTLWRWNKSGYLRFSKVGVKRRYKMSDIDRILKGGSYGQ